jgi:hypothetical protein
MLDEATLEQRLTTLEKAVSDLQCKFEPKPNSDNWLQKLIGSISDEEAFAQVLEYGQAFRKSDQPFDDINE